MKFFITGAAGSLGSAICAKLIADHHKVVGFDLADSPLQNSHYHHITGNLVDRSLISASLNDCDCIIHTAIFKGDYDQNSTAAFSVNVEGTFNIYDAIKNTKTKAVLISSAPVDKNPPNSPLNWKSHSSEDHTYDLTKRLQEEIARDYYETFGVPTIILRMGHIVDENNMIDPNYCVGGWVEQSDAVLACVLAANYTKTNFDIFNVIGSYQAHAPYDIKRTMDALSWQPIYLFEGQA
jgi:nucleoside-diphosphate-sugar epimerase